MTRKFNIALKPRRVIYLNIINHILPFENFSTLSHKKLTAGYLFMYLYSIYLNILKAKDTLKETIKVLK